MSRTEDTLAPLRASLARYLADHYAFDQRRTLLDAASSRAPLWDGLAELGLTAAPIDEALGGIGMPLADTLPVMETLGEALAAEPYLSTVVIAGGLLSATDTARARETLRGIADGSAIVAFAHEEPHRPVDAADLRSRLLPGKDGFTLTGRKSVVMCAPWATHLLVTALDGAGDVRLALIDTGTRGVVQRDFRTVGGGWASELRFDGVAVAPDAIVDAPGTGAALLDRALDVAAIAISLESIGVMRRMLADTIAYASQRRQFGVPIASFQVLQHRIVDMHIAFEQARVLAAAATSQVEAGAADRARAASAAKVIASRACRIVGQGALQVHGAMGMTDELAVGHYFKRATAIELSFGSMEWHLRRIDALQPGLTRPAFAASPA